MNPWPSRLFEHRCSKQHWNPDDNLWLWRHQRYEVFQAGILTHNVLQSHIARRYLYEKLKGAFPCYIGHWSVLPSDGLALHTPSAKEEHLLGVTRSRCTGAPVMWPCMTILTTTYQPRFTQYPRTPLQRPPRFQDHVALQTSHFHVSEAFVNSIWWVNDSLTLNEVTPF